MNNDFKKKTDHELVELFVTSHENSSAFTCLVQRHETFLSKFCDGIFDKEKLQEKSDLLQESFVTAIERLRQGKYSPDLGFKSFMTRIIMRTSNKMFPKQKIIFERYEQPDISHDSNIVRMFIDRVRPDANDPESTIIKKEVASELAFIVKNVIVDLDPILQKIIVLLLIEKFSPEEVCDELNISTYTFIKTLKKGRVFFESIQLKVVAA